MAKYEKKKGAASSDSKKKSTTPETSRKKEDAELDRSYRSLGGKAANGNKKKGAAIACFAAVVVLLVIAMGAWLLLSPKDGNVPAGVTAAGVDLGGMSREEALRALTQATQNTYSRNPMVVQVEEQTLELYPATTGASLNVEQAVDAALSAKGTDAQVLDITPYLNLREDAIREALTGLAADVTSEYTGTSIRLEGSIPTEITAESPEAVLSITLGTPEKKVDQDALYRQILAAYNNNVFSVSYQPTGKDMAPDGVDLEALWEEYCTEPADAVLDEKTGEITPEINGYGFDKEAAAQALAQAKPGDTVTLTLSPMIPEVTESSLKGSMFLDELASYDSPYNIWETDRNTNLDLACRAIDGIVLQPGEVFSFNDTLGERTAEKGYKGAGTYVGGQTVDSIGGGICQVASTLYYCTLMADLETVERECHMYCPDYVPRGMDATIYWDSLDFAFRNSSNHPVRIDASASDGYIHIRLMGTDDKDYYVKMEFEIVSTYDWKTTYKDMEPDNAQGYEDGDTITYPVTGYYVETFKCRYDKETGELISRKYEAGSDYDHRDKVVCRIPEQPTETEPTTQATEPSTQDTESPDILIGGGVSQDGGD